MAKGRLEESGLTLLEVAPEMQNLPYAEGDQSRESEEEEIANSVVGRLCEGGGRAKVSTHVQRCELVANGVGDGSARLGNSSTATAPEPAVCTVEREPKLLRRARPGGQSRPLKLLSSSQSIATIPELVCALKCVSAPHADASSSFDRNLSTATHPFPRLTTHRWCHASSLPFA
jgi:hypothetical protein